VWEDVAWGKTLAGTIPNDHETEKTANAKQKSMKQCGGSVGGRNSSHVGRKKGRFKKKTVRTIPGIGKKKIKTMAVPQNRRGKRG